MHVLNTSHQFHKSPQLEVRVLSSKIIIAEKADAGRRIAYILSQGSSKQKRPKGMSYIEFEKDGVQYYLIPLSGHVVEINFPESMKDWKSVDLNELIDSRIVHNAKNRNAVNTLQALSKGADTIVVATDYDREGELIGVEAVNIIKEAIKKSGDEPNIRRAKFSALTRDEVSSAFDDLIDVDYHLADSASAREEIDLIWGAALTRFISVASNRYGKDFLSVGRVQTPTLGLIVNRELEIEAFVPQKFWKLQVVFNKKGDFTGDYEGGDVFDEKEADRILEGIEGRNGTVQKFERREERIGRPPPFNTTEFLREASRIQVAPAKAMNIAESLYMRGLISYPRTDNTVYQKSINLKGVLNKLRDTEFVEEVEKVLSQEKIYPSRGRTEATDHPPIYPTSAAKKGSLKGDYAKIYELVVRRFLATLYKEGQREVREATLKVGDFNFATHGVTITQRGWLEIYKYYHPKENYHPDLEEGEEVQAKDWQKKEDMTKPPRRYDISSLLKKMEELNLGTKSTRHDIIAKLQARGFIEGNPVRPTPLGIGLIKSILTVESKIAEPEMTATLEVDMDKIANRQVGKEDVVKISRDMLHGVLRDLKSNEALIRETIREHLKMGKPIGECPLHKGKNILHIKERSFSRLKCEVEGCRIDFKAPSRVLIQLAEKECPVCSLPQIKAIRRGQSPDIRCIDPACEFNTKKDNFGKCPKDGGNLVVRQSRYGKRFLGCSSYPDCTMTYPLPQMGSLQATGEVCQHCGSPLIVAFRNQRKWEFCPKMDCEFNKKKGKSESPKKKKGGKAAKVRNS